MEPENPKERREIGKAGNESTSKKKPYAAPRLTVYGHISKLTASGSQAGGDKVKKKACL